jgi:PD-(D/E)XK nuclease superfamily
MQDLKGNLEQGLVLQEPPDEAQSPFLEGTKTQFAWDSTSLGWLKTCPRLYQYNMIEGWRSKEESVHLRFGIEVHQAIEDYERCRATGISHEDSVHAVVHELLLRTADWGPENTYKNRPNLVRTVIWYLDNYSNDPAVTYIREDGKPAVEVSFRFELEWGPDESQPYLLCGHLDRIVNFAGDLYVMDHKTTTTTPGAYYFNQFEPNNQMTLYTLASQVVMHAPIKGVILDVIQVGVEFSRFTRGFTFRTPDIIDDWLLDLRHYLELAVGYAKAGYWPMNDTACDKFGGCRFREVCSKSPQVREQFLKSGFERGERWNPLKTRG